MAQVFSDISYGASPKSRVDIHEPDTYNFANQSGPDPKAVLLYLHGGGWSAGDKAIDASNYVCFGGDADPDFQDKPQCSLMADNGNYVVISANYDLLGPDPVPDPTPCLAPRGDGYYPNNINQLIELLKFLIVPGYATGVNQATWELLNRFVLTYGLVISGGSAGGQLAYTSAFETANSTGHWARGILNVVGPMDLVNSAENPLPPGAQSLVNAYTNSNLQNQEDASPYYQRINYESYTDFDDLSDPLAYQTKTRLAFWYNTNDTLVPTTAITRFISWAQSELGTGFVIDVPVTEGTVTPGVESHNVTTPLSEIWVPMTDSICYQGLNYPKVQQKLRPTQGMVYPRPYIYRYPRST